MTNIVRIKSGDAELLGYAMLDLDNACANLIEMQHPLADTLFHMVHSIMFYVEDYLLHIDQQDIYKLPRPVPPEFEESKL